METNNTHHLIDTSGLGLLEDAGFLDLADGLEKKRERAGSNKKLGSEEMRNQDLKMNQGVT